MFCEKFTIIRHHTECSFPMKKWSRARLRYGIHFWWLHNAKGVGPAQFRKLETVASRLLRKRLFPAKRIMSECPVARAESSTVLEPTIKTTPHLGAASADRIICSRSKCSGISFSLDAAGKRGVTYGTSP